MKGLKLVLALLLALALTPTAEAIKTRRQQVYAASHYANVGAGGPFTFVSSVSVGSDGSGTTMATSTGGPRSDGSLDLLAGDLLVGMVSFEDGTGAETVTVASQANVNVLTVTASDAAFETTFKTSVFPVFKLAAAAQSGAVFTATISAPVNPARQFKRLIVFQYRPPTGANVTLDIAGTRKATGNGSAITTGQFSTTGSHTIICGLEAIYTGGSHSQSLIGPLLAEDTRQQNGAYQWCARGNAPLANIVAQTTYTASREWAATAIAFNATGGSYVDTIPPYDPTGLTGTIGDAQVALTWSHALASDVHHYRVQYDCGGGYTTFSPDPTTTSATVTGLPNETACNLKVAAVDAAGNVSGYTTPISLTPTATPIRSAGSPSTALPSGTTSTTISLTTSKNATCRYSTTAGTAYGSMLSTFTGAGTKSHTATASPLSNGSSYNYYVRCDDGSGHTNLNDYAISFSVAQVFVSNCTDGVNCYCDTANYTGDAARLFCEDFEASGLYEPGPTDWAAGSSGDRGGNSYWANTYPNDGSSHFRVTDPTPSYGIACNPGGGLTQCSGSREYCSAAQGAAVTGARDCWGPGANSGSCMDIQRGTDFQDEVPTLTLTGGKGTNPAIGAGNTTFADRVGIGVPSGAGATCGFTGTKSFPAKNEIGTTQIVAMGSNAYTSRAQLLPMKFPEWSGNDADPNQDYAEYAGFGLTGAGGQDLNPIRPILWTISCTNAFASAVAHVGQFNCSGGEFYAKLGPTSATYQQNVQWPVGTYACHQYHISGMGTSNVSYKVWVNGTLHIWIDGINGAYLRNPDYKYMQWDNYANANAWDSVNGYQGGPSAPIIEPFYRYWDNLHVRNGPPVSCASIGWQ